ncbi:ferrochelatase [Marinithermus hydrothermalis]|uniref:Ferrochelatase n=1 Tax=Marinithermus hydrothermalis (strain DSM 14884 / JCM 11576 / T1) TaxID=869210 RepID=F2NP82_MARHT|nr:ferrochelatase [Marinithermus hydrothermalis]AEB11883.1 Ferrochelatase [Marinithermus hydrothermalis DSM 14884]
MPDVLLMAYGTPYREEEIEPYYTDIRRGNPPPAELLEELTQRYRAIGKSPLNEITFAQAERLAAALGEGSRVWVGMKHWRPWIRDAVREMAEAGVQRAVAVVAAPHYSLRSIAEYRERVERALEALGNPFEVRFVEDYHDHPLYIDAVAYRVQEALWRVREPEQAVVLFTAHSIPERAVQADGGRYPAQVRRTGELVAQRIGLSRWRVAWQSAGRTAEPWIGPDILEELEALAREGVREVVVAAVGFPADHLEVLYDIDYEAQEAAKQLGMRLVRARSLNADEDYIRVLKDVVERAWR